MPRVTVKCSPAKTIIGTPKNKRPNGRIFSSPRSCGSSFLMRMGRPIAKSNAPRKYGQKTVDGGEKITSVPHPYANCWRSPAIIWIQGPCFRASSRGKGLSGDKPFLEMT